jgi:ribosomal protein L21E
VGSVLAVVKILVLWVYRSGMRPLQKRARRSSTAESGRAVDEFGMGKRTRVSNMKRSFQKGLEVRWYGGAVGS